jgi:molybdate transport system substrate-binding protein
LRTVRLPLLAVLLLVTLAACGPGQERQSEVVISAAASLKDALTEIQSAYEAAHPTVKLRLNFGSSGALQRQIEQGAPADLFIPAAPENVTALVSQGLVAQADVWTVVTNQVVLVRPANSAAPISGWEDLKSPGITRLAIGNPQHVPAGQYGKGVLEHLGLWAAVQPRLILGEDVRQVLHYVETGEVAAGIVYRSDAASARDVIVVAEAPAGSHPPVTYPLAVLKGAPDDRAARALADYLRSPAAQAIFKKYGFGGAS